MVDEMKIKTPHQRTISALVQDRPGVLSRISGLFRRRGFNISSLAVGRSEKSGLSRMTFVVEGSENVLKNVADQLEKLIDVVEARDITEKNIVWRELALIKVKFNQKNRSEILELASIFRANIIDIGVETVIMEITGGKNKINSLIELLNKFSVREVIRTGRVATLRGTLTSGMDDGEFQQDNSVLPLPQILEGTGSV
jgi:acetolactate synthase-1/3 small subunit|tara:strand:- start:57 stop:650 length:594 start_codon:yes stop_codon:yes gene_type:complete